MKRRYAAIALPILVCGATVAGAAPASARAIDPDDPHHPQRTIVQHPETTVVIQVPVDDTANEIAQTIAGAVVGAGLASGALWYYYRRHPYAR
ncbi:hypothetical protein [Kribbella sp. NPDC004875]|uniref:hypothetical protein n=1 Tax=Kribbella sp. NPDC004875 TaxID=3364107 RepID=UPI0036B38639